MKSPPESVSAIASEVFVSFGLTLVLLLGAIALVSVFQLAVSPSVEVGQ